MLVETSKSEFILNQNIGKKRENRIIETDIIVNDVKPDVLNIVSTSGIINIYKKEILNKKIKIDGAINTYVMYVADDEHASIRSLNTSIDFTQIIDMEEINDNNDITVNVSLKSFDTKIINGRKLNIKANLEFNIKAYSNEKVGIITNIENNNKILMLNNIQKIVSLVGSGSNKVSAKDTIAIDASDDLAEIMRVNFKIIDEETKISYNKVLSKADAEINILYLTEDNRINSVTTKIPIMGFVDIQNVNENCKCEIQNNLCNMIIKPNVTTEHTIGVEIEIDVNCEAYETKEINVIEDMYCVDKEVTFNKKEINAIIERNKICDTYILNENIRIPELAGRVLNVNTIPEITSSKARNGKIIYEGNINLEILFEQNSGVNLQTVDLPFNFEIISENIENCSEIQTQLKIKQDDFSLKDGVMGATIGIEFNVSEQKNRVLNIIDNVEINESENCCTYSMVIYFVKPGDTLWNIAKMFKSTVEDIAKTNNIENSDKINVGQQLFIPRFCTKKVAV